MHDVPLKTRLKTCLLILGSALVLKAQIISTAAGSTAWGGPLDVALDSAGNMYVADYAGDAVYKIDRLANATMIAGTGKGGFSGDGGLATAAQLNGPTAVAVDPSGTIYIADLSNNRIRKVAPNGIITTFAGNGRAGFSGDGGQALLAMFNFILDLELDAAGNLYVCDYNNARIRKITPAGIVSTIAGTGTLGSAGTGGPAKAADIAPSSIHLLADGTIFFTDAGYRGNAFAPKVRKILPDSTVALVAGTGSRTFSGDGGPAIAAGFASLDGVAVDSAGNVYAAEYNGARIRKIAVNGIITTFAGTGVGGLLGDGGPAKDGRINGPVGMIVDSSGNLLFADYNNRRIRKVAPPPSPAISFNDTAIPSFLGKAGFTSNSYVEIYGTNLSTTTRTWAGGDFTGANAPTSLDGVTVTINGKNAFVYYISPTQININAPEDTATGPVNIQVQNSFGFSNTGSATRNRVAPSLQSVPQFNVGGKQYVVAQTPDFKSFIGTPGMLQGVSFVAPKPGDTVIIFALGCGPTNPATQAGVIASQGAPLALPYQVKIGGIPARVDFGGIVGGSIGLYQFNVVIPAVNPGVQTIELIVDGIPNAQSLVIVVG